MHSSIFPIKTVDAEMFARNKAINAIICVGLSSGFNYLVVVVVWWLHWLGIGWVNSTLGNISTECVNYEWDGFFLSFVCRILSWRWIVACNCFIVDIFDTHQDCWVVFIHSQQFSHTTRCQSRDNRNQVRTDHLIIYNLHNFVIVRTISHEQLLIQDVITVFAWL